MAENASIKRLHKDWHYLALLLLLVLPLRLWLLWNTEVAARDSIGFIRYALQFESKSWKETLLANHQHPGYPLAIWAVSQPVRALAGTDAVTMRLSAQLASTLAALALLVPMYYLGKELFDRQIGFWGALLFQYLPVSGHHLSDGISEALFLFLVTMALWRGVPAVRGYKPLEFAWCGLFGGLAYLTRPEGALVVLAAALVLAGMQLTAGLRARWSRFCACGMSLGCAAAAVGGIYVLTTGHLTNKPAVEHIRDSIARQKHDAEPKLAPTPRGPLLASVFGVFIKRTDDLPTRLGRALGAMGAEFTQGFHYVGWAPALLGLFWSWSRLRGDPGFWLPAGYCLVHGAILLLLAMVEFYVSDRHMMVLILCGSFFMVAGVREAVERLCRWVNQTQASRLATIALVLLATFCLPKTAQRLHSNRIGNHQAGVWLAPRLETGDMVEDDHAYTHYYAGQVFLEGKEPPVPSGYHPLCYVVVTRSKDAEIGVGRNEKEDGLRRHALLVYQWPENRPLEEARVVVYAELRNWERNPWTVRD